MYCRCNFPSTLLFSVMATNFIERSIFILYLLLEIIIIYLVLSHIGNETPMINTNIYYLVIEVHIGYLNYLIGYII